jgi:hypothetical protein
VRKDTALTGIAIDSSSSLGNQAGTVSLFVIAVVHGKRRIEIRESLTRRKVFVTTSAASSGFTRKGVHCSARLTFSLQKTRYGKPQKGVR